MIGAIVRLLIILVIIGIAAIFGIAFFLFSGASSFRKSMRNCNQETRGYSTSRSSQSYYDAQSSKRDKYSKRYNGPTAKRTYKSGSAKTSSSSSSSSSSAQESGASSQSQSNNADFTSPQREVVEVQLLEVSDVHSEQQ